MRGKPRFVTFTIACLVAGIGAVQESKNKLPLGWGKVINPDGDCKITGKDDSVTIEVPGKAHNLVPALQKVNAPRILGDVKGDFIAEVEVLGSIQPGGRSTSPPGLPYHGAGLLIWQDEKNLVRFERAAILRNGQVVSYVNLEVHAQGQPPAARPAQVQDKPIHLRLERRGAKIIGSISPDGIAWSALEPLEAQVADSVKLGVAAVNTSSQPFKAELKGLEVFTRAVGR
jgi:regulation of enolase protein 1 (concanavalin A-like superfamily)